MKISTKRILSILLSAFFLMATLVVYGSLIQSEITASSALQSAVASKINLYNSQKAAVAQVAGLISQFQSAAKLQETVGLAMPIGPNTTQALNQWQAISAANQVNLQSLDIKSDQLSKQKVPAQSLVKKLQNIPTQVNATGGYGALKQFLNSIETNARVMNVSSFTFRTMSGSQAGLPAQAGLGGNQNYSLELNVVTFYQEN
ncbi:MAG: hypothetical protein AAB399_00100 [Patescibacteria group bacterium]